MKCPSCGFDSEGKICNRCGASLNVTEPMPAEQQISSPPLAPVSAGSSATGRQAKQKQRYGPAIGCLAIIGALVLFGMLSSDKKASPATSTSGTKAAIEAPKPEPAKPALEVLSVDWKRESYVLYAVGEIRNNTKKTYGYVQVSINVYDKSDAQIGSTMANLNNLEPGATWKFKAVVTQENAYTFKVMNVTGF